MTQELVSAMYAEYLRGWRLVDVARKYNLRSGTTVLYHFHRHHLKTRPRGGAIKESQIGNANGNWRGVIVRRMDGSYTRIWKPSHPRADSLGYVLEHILNAEKKLGRAIASTEVVHHINGRKNDNRPENLIICKNQTEHLKIHQEAKNVRRQ